MLTVKQLAEWADFYGREPWGFHVSDVQHGMLNATVAAVAGAQDITPKTFMLSSILEAATAKPEDETLEMLHKLIPPARVVEREVDAPAPGVTP